MYDRVFKSGLCAFLVSHHEKDGADADTVEGSGDKERRALHLRGEAAHPLPCLPLVLEFVGYRHDLRHVLAVKCILALHDADMIRK